MLWQRFGRVARNPDREGVAVLFAEPKYFDDWKAEQAKCHKVREEKKMTKAIDKERAGHVTSQDDELTSSSGREASTSEACADSNENATELAGPEDRDRDLSIFEQLRVEFERRTSSKVPPTQGKKRKTDEDEEVSVEMDSLINASSRSFKCYRAPIQAFYKNDRVCTYHCSLLGAHLLTRNTQLGHNAT